ncbi:MAG: Na+:solute symporter [Leptospiraceae bacterium]|jgi:Na+/proline symporter|nr:Na+:solute symporter [Leptospiraceae bacterium]
MFTLSIIDYAIIFIYFCFVISVGFFFRKKASRNLFSFFTADKNYGWIWIGTSMVATTFSADTPLAIAGITANKGISGNWFWWSWILTYMTITIFYSKLWWRSKIITDVEFTEIRYSGKEASYLRFIKAFYFSILLNGIILGWVFLSIQKIITPFILPDYEIPWFKSIYPKFLLVGDYNLTFILILLLIIVVLYSSLSGVRGGVFNDMFQFIIAMGGSIFFAYYTVESIGGPIELKNKIVLLYPEKHQEILSLFPNWQEMGYIILIYFGIQWWTQYYSDGTGYLVQRLNTAKSERDAQLGSLWFNFANFAIRTWPWVFIGLSGLVIYPQTPEACKNHLLVCNDRELVYPILIKELLPAGLQGFMLTGLIAAFMSTVETHLNWGASYIANDFYKRYIKPNSTEKEQIIVSKLGVLIMAIIGIIFANQMKTISGAWKFLIAIAAGIGFPQMIRWFWWRANAYTEISGMVASLVFTGILYSLFDTSKIPDEYLLFFIAIFSGIISLVATLITKPVDQNKLIEFTNRVKPYGFWKPIMKENKIQPLLRDLFLWFLGNISILSFMLSIAYWIFRDYHLFLSLFFVFLLTGIPVIVVLIKRESDEV